MTDQRIRVIIDNDFSGDPDGLVQLAHHVPRRMSIGHLSRCAVMSGPTAAIRAQ
jgi:hypothetical protein